MDSRNPRGDYEQQQPGGAGRGGFDIDRRTYCAKRMLLAECSTEGTASVASPSFEATKPDPRVTLTVVVGFVPLDGSNVFTVDEWGVTLATRLSAANIWLAKCESFGGGLREVEDIFGTNLARAAFIPDGSAHYGATWEVDEDCMAVRGVLGFMTPNHPGRFMVEARWVAVQPMSEADWMRARENMFLTVERAEALYILPPPPR